MFTEAFKSIISFFFSFSLVSNLPEVKLTFYGSTYSDNVNITVNNLADFSALPLSKFDASKRTEIYIHSANEGANYEGPITVIDAYLAKKSTLDINVVLIDWGLYAQNMNYHAIMSKINSVSDTAIKIIDECKLHGFKIDQTHLVGHSFGSMIAGRIARWFTKERNISFPRITGIEPANILRTLNLQYILKDIEQLKRSDAPFVDIIHTDVSLFGDKNVNGHLDFWPNGGILQPNCGKFDNVTLFDYIGCSHNRVWAYYAESIGNPNAFLAKQCEGTTYTDEKCQGPTTAYMGYFASPSVAGFSATSTLNFYLKTNGVKPFSKS